MLNKGYRKQTGSVLVYVVVVMVISLVIAGGLYILSSTTSYTVPFVKLGQRAFYLAEAGYRYAASEFLTSKNFEDQIEILERLDNSTYHFDDGSSFTLHVYPYFFILDQNYSKATKVTLKTPGTIPPQMNFPETGMLQIGVENDPYRYSNGKKISNNQVQVVLDRPLTAKKYDPVFFAFYPNNNQFVEYGGELKLNWDEDKISIFPDRNGYFEIKDKGAFNYDFKRRGSVILSGIKKYTESKKHYEEFATFEVTPSDIVILKPNVKILSKGTVSSLSFLSSSRKISYYVPITEDYYSSGGGTQVLQLSDEPGGQDKFDNLKNWITTDNTHKYVTTKANIGSNHGWSKNWATYHDLPLQIDFNPTLMDSGTNEDLHAIWGNSWDNVYVVGGKGTVLHYDGNTWNKMSTPVEVTLRDIYGFGDKGDEKMVAVGDKGEILEWEGSEWKRVLMKDYGNITFTEHDLYGVWGYSWDNITTYGDHGSSPFKWDQRKGNWPRYEPCGCKHKKCGIENENCYKYYYFSKGIKWRPYDIYQWFYFNYPWRKWNFRSTWETNELGRLDLFACGETTEGKAFIFKEQPAPETTYYLDYSNVHFFNGIWGSSLSDIYVVGEKGKIYHSNNGNDKNSWKEQESNTNKDLNGIWGQTCGDLVYAVGDKGTIIYNLMSSSEWTNPDLNITNEDLNEVWGDPDVGVYAVGNKGTIVFMGFVGNPYKGFILPFKSSKFNEIEEYWKSHRKTLTYTAQVKVGWGYKLEYGATGLNFRWHENENYKGIYEGYGISFMRYQRKNKCENDYIPNAIKPKYGMENDLSDKLLIVLWRQKIVNGAVKRDWIAYKDVTNDEKLLGDSWEYSGRLEDLSTISVQVHEKIIAGQKVNDVKIFYGDASTAQDEPHNPDYLYNNTNRAAYNPTYSDVSITDIKWPLWDLNAWDPDHDYFTLVCNVPVGENPTYDGNDYWIINPEIDEAKLLPDGSTIRLTGFTSPDGDKFISGDAHSRPEIAIHAYGDINSLNSQTFVSFSEFAISLGADGEEDSSRGGFGRLK